MSPDAAGWVRGIDTDTTRRAIAEGDPLPGDTTPPVRGFAGRIAEGRLVRDVLGREPLFVDVNGGTWAFDPTELDTPEPFQPGAVGPPDRPESIWTLPAPEPADDRRAIKALVDAVAAALDDAPDAPVAFSGGVDSSVVATGTTGPLYAVGFPDSPDLEAARDAARAFDRPLRVVELEADTLERAVGVVARATGRTNPMDVGIAVPLYLAAERAAADGFDRLAVGQGADELFGGYAKVAAPCEDPRVAADTVRGARREQVLTLPDQLPRDVLAMRAAGVEPVAPLLDDRVVSAALTLPAELLVDARGERKVGFRRVAHRRLPARVAYRHKRAVQYGSRVSRELDRLARRAGFKRREDDHVARYVASLL